ncbi:MAG: hypothetical protein KDC79_09195 [Cyclobacteriaceae bacterium]|nr:hypothetical protein [Cyclobacteriaceae bacterium]
MLKYIYFFTLVLILQSCSKPAIELSDFDQQKWIQDKDGCNETRKSIVGTLLEQKSKLLGAEQVQITKLLGKPDKLELYERSQFFLIYSIDPGKSCPNFDSTKIDNVALRFNALGRVSEVIYYQ